MQIVVPEILESARGLSVGICATGLALGLLLWLLGWRGHRFWIVLVATVSAGILGLYSGPAYGTQPVVAGLLLAVAAGALALALVRLVAFIAGGVASWTLVHTLVPTFDEPLVCFLVGGLIGLLLFRLWTMALTSFAGAVLMLYSMLFLLDKLGKIDALNLANTQAPLLNWSCLGVAALGLAIQFLLDRRRGRQPDAAGEQKPKSPGRSKDPEENRGWLGWTKATYRRAG